MSGAIGGVLVPGISGSLLSGWASDDRTSRVPGTRQIDLPPRTIALRTQGGAFRFDPEGLWIDPQSLLTWLNMGDFHTTTAFHPDNSHLVAGDLSLRIPKDAEPWHSGMLGLDAGTQFERTFSVEGVYDYLCQPHYGFGMVGRLIVGQPHGGAAVTRSTTDLPPAVQEHLPSVEAITGSLGRTYEWASRINGVLLLLANAKPAASAARAVIAGVTGDTSLLRVLDRAGLTSSFNEALSTFAENVDGQADYEVLVRLADLAKDPLIRARDGSSL